MCNSKSAAAGCLAGILRRILCSGNLPTHPSDQIREADSVVCDKDQELKAAKECIERFEASASPGIVARLMGLDSIPEINNLLHERSKPNSISRCRSMNSADQLAGLDSMQGQHRRVKSTLSFREMPTFLELENENFLILSFETGGENKELRSKGKKSETGFGELKQRRAERRKNGENRAERVSEKRKKKTKNNKGCQEANKKVLNDLNEPEKQSKRISDNGKSKGSSITRSLSKNSHEKPYVSSEAVKTSKPVKHKEVFHGRKLSERKKTSLCVVQNTESECSSEDSSPVSVLDFGHFLTDPEILISESSLADSKSRRKLSPELENHKQQSARKDSNLIGDELKTKKVEGKYHGAKKKECQSQNYVDMWDEISRLTGAELVGSNWVYRKMWKHEDFEDIGVNFELEILDQLLDELVGQLSGLP
ncbi:hypothetical protein FH972_011708 [Carpinus fangiana]|uniref:DUF3741 domain-containing protein n=1 Tax=Carpinus fangiana TaxID=176857 RepID=A0A660KU87_9ROSI|nr:hypothetical protein FH972_011708 [Carpinus fangiana]